ncbi:MAG: aminotransferase class I/II-fold pyridoxal phosphate-dependent enzyme [Acidimicrobiia bacterium]
MAELIEAEIAAGRLAGGDRLPSIRETADSFSLAPNTVAAAYRRLADRGVVMSRGRAGTFVLDRPPLGVHRSPAVPAGSVDLASGGPDPRLLPDLGRFVVHTGPSSSYIDPPILPELVDAGTRWLSGQGYEARRLIVTSGGLDAIERVLVAHLRPGDAVAVERPGWSAVTDLVAALGMRSMGVEIDDRGMRPADLAERLGAVDAVVVTPRAQNPTGAALDAARRDALLDVLKAKPDVLVIEDDHAGPVAGTPLHALSPGLRRWAFVQSVAKALGPDLRLALVAGDDLTLDRVSGRFGVGPGWVSRILQGAVAAMMSDPEVGRRLTGAASEYTLRRDTLMSALAEGGLNAVTGRSGLNVWAQVGSEDGAVTAAADEGFVVRGGGAFFADQPAIRITVSNLTMEDIPRLVAAVTDRGDPGRRLV